MDVREARLADLYRAHARRVYAYARRHAGRELAEEVVNEVFLDAWRQLDQLPDDPLPWLLTVARRKVARGHDRDARLRTAATEYARLAGLAADAAESTALARATTLSALAHLPVRDREALLLVAWDGLEPGQAARVAGCSVAAFYVRLHRARKRLDLLTRDAGPARMIAERNEV